MELFACVADMQGEGLPLSYLFITTEENTARPTKQSTDRFWENGQPSSMLFVGDTVFSSVVMKKELRVNLRSVYQRCMQRPLYHSYLYYLCKQLVIK